MDSRLYKHSFKVQERPISSLSVYNTGSQCCEGGYSWGPGVRDHYLIHLVMTGRGSYWINGQTYSLGEGDMFLSRPGETILYTADMEIPWSYCWVGFNGLEAATLLQQTDYTLKSPILHWQDTGEPMALLLDIYRSSGSKAHDTARMTGKLYSFLAWLIEHAEYKTQKRRQIGEEYVGRACEFIANNFSTPITIEDVAAHVGVCRSRLYRAFEEYMEISPTQYLTRFRMQQACLLLEKTDLSVKAVAFSVGFEDALYFSRRFREVVGRPPREYANGCRVPGDVQGLPTDPKNSER